MGNTSGTPIPINGAALLLNKQGGSYGPSQSWVFIRLDLAFTSESYAVVTTLETPPVMYIN